MKMMFLKTLSKGLKESRKFMRILRKIVPKIGVATLEKLRGLPYGESPMMNLRLKQIVFDE